MDNSAFEKFCALFCKKYDAVIIFMQNNTAIYIINILKFHINIYIYIFNLEHEMTVRFDIFKY